MPINESKMVQSVYDTLFNAYTKTPPGGLPAGSQENKMFMIMVPGGEPIDSKQYANPLSPNNPQGTPAAIENFSRLVDRLPFVKTAYVDSTKRVSEVYKAVVEGANITPQPENPAQKAAYDKAYDLITDEADDFDDAGQPIKIPVDSPLYANYKRKQNAYADAVASFMAEFSKYDLTKPADQRAWSIIGPSKQRILTTAWNDFQTAQAKKVEDALATIAQSSQNQIGRVFKDAQERLTLLEKGSVRDPMEKLYYSYAMPANWYSSNAAQGWTSMAFSSGKYQVNQTSNYTSYGGNVGFSLGLWSAGGGFNRSVEQRHMDTQTENLDVSFRYARISIDRPWMNGMVFDLPGWTYSPVAAGGVSSGNPATAEGTLMTIVPTGFIAVRDLKISANWSSAESDYIRKQLSANAGFGWGPFSIGGAYKSDSSQFNFKSEFDGRTINAPGLQIMGYICTVLPLAPKA
ncbi:MAG: hypothetical protein RLZZ511_3448 [Cyanobacteriota bacterium]|jgi:hypothetical protein